MQNFLFDEKVYFVSGIDTDIGKTVVTGWLARELMKTGKRAATLKLVQTGAQGFSPDIATHRKIMGVELEEDATGITAPVIFSHPSSPHLASRLDQQLIDFEYIDACICILEKKYDVVLIEGAGGLMVPLTDSLLTIDYLHNKGWPLLFVSNAKLGSINHTLLSLEAIRNRGIELAGFVWNSWCPQADPFIAQDTRAYLKQKLQSEWPHSRWLECPSL